MLKLSWLAALSERVLGDKANKGIVAETTPNTVTLLHTGINTSFHNKTLRLEGFIEDNSGCSILAP